MNEWTSQLGANIKEYIVIVVKLLLFCSNANYIVIRENWYDYKVCWIGLTPGSVKTNIRIFSETFRSNLNSVFSSLLSCFLSLQIEQISLVNPTLNGPKTNFCSFPSFYLQFNYSFFLLCFRNTSFTPIYKRVAPKKHRKTGQWNLLKHKLKTAFGSCSENRSFSFDHCLTVNVKKSFRFLFN